MAIDIEITGIPPEELDRVLAHIDVRLRNEAIEKSLKAASKPVIKEYRQRITAPGYKGDKPNKRALRASVGYKQKRYKDGQVVVGIVGARVNQPWSAYHAHLYEDGHRMVVSRGPRKGEDVGFVEGRRVFATSVDNTTSAQQRLMRDKLAEYLRPESK